MKRLFVAMFALAGCAPDFPAPPSLVDGIQVLAVRGNPAEQKPKMAASFDALIASPDGDVTARPAWAFCYATKTLGENGAVDPGCLAGSVDSINPSSAAIPDDACKTFGPDVPPGGTARPRDPDATGGYYLPVRVTIGGVVAFGLERLSCGLANAPAPIAAMYRMTYRPNENPKLEDVRSSIDLASVSRGATVRFEAVWSDGSAERYPVFDPQSQSLAGRREAMSVSWFATSGAFASDRTGVAGGDLARSTANDWVAPDGAATVHMWVVLRDDRGGVDWVLRTVEVR